jgi:hypothetical protein
MKMKELALVAALVAALSAIAIPRANAAPGTKTTDAVKVLKVVPCAELPAKAAELVVSAMTSERQATAIAVIRAVAAKNPYALVSVVACIAKAAPDTAEVTARTAATLWPKEAASIALAASKAAPPAADKITAAITPPAAANGNHDGHNPADGDHDGNNPAHPPHPPHPPHPEHPHDYGR